MSASASRGARSGFSTQRWGQLHFADWLWLQRNGLPPQQAKEPSVQAAVLGAVETNSEHLFSSSMRSRYFLLLFAQRNVRAVIFCSTFSLIFRSDNRRLLKAFWLGTSDSHKISNFLSGPSRNSVIRMTLRIPSRFLPASGSAATQPSRMPVHLQPG